MTPLLKSLMLSVLVVAGANPAFAGPEVLKDPILRIDNRLDRLLGKDADLAIVHSGVGFFEGPRWIEQGASSYLAFTDLAGNAIRRLNADGTASTIIGDIFVDADASEAPIFKVGSRYVALIGPNGLARDPEGRFVYCSFATHQIVRLETDGRKTVMAERYRGKLLNTPNDLLFKADGSVYFTDSDSRSAIVRAADRSRTEDDPKKGALNAGVYRLRNGELDLLTTEVERPNGIAFSPDESVLYVSDTVKRKIWKFEVKADGRLANGRTFFDMSANKEAGVADGLKVDAEGNVYSTGPGGLWIFTSGGDHIGTVRTPEYLTNAAFGGPDGKTLYLTGPSNIYRIKTNVSAPK